MSGIAKRGKGNYHFRMRVPKKYHCVIGKKEIHRSLGTDSKRQAAELVPVVRKSILDKLEALLIFRDEPGCADIFRAAQIIIESGNFDCLPKTSLLAAPLEETLAQFKKKSVVEPEETAPTKPKKARKPKKEDIRLSQLVDVVEKYRAHDNRYKDTDQMRKWINPRKRTVNNLLQAIGKKDIFVSEVNASIAMKHKLWWQTKVAEKGLNPETANKDFNYMRSVISDYYASIAKPNPPTPYAGIGLKKERYQKKKRKNEVPVEWIKEKWFAPKAFKGLNEEARDILLISIETGCRQSEISHLPPQAIVLDDPIPHIRIAVEEGSFRREIKNAASHRQIPLVGVALAAAKRHPNGFPRYRGNSSYSSAINKYLRENGLLPEKDYTAGGTRHTFESRMKAAGIASDDRGEMMGHSVRAIRDRELYGDEMDLKEKLRLVNLIALPEPAHLK
ncbi:hypothetical protein FDK21_20170 [Cohaesibacter sp. CAU 1516]|uniref:DUF6538 domain-containing protein n=1 Tax=Cohaesibacter sp. CAU 1516 TaxID=2576038 RepID=UPI0010FE3D1B|nr:DUF6538 domain-containing protein [Cohaesibacter sp. CAU 1516]TLP42176.1 hypothetical protein FDK21_20170 [Cohaesibacter sp. CAU 1516]